LFLDAPNTTLKKASARRAMNRVAKTWMNIDSASDGIRMIDAIGRMKKNNKRINAMMIEPGEDLLVPGKGPGL
jgi:hypothetical protein